MKLMKNKFLLLRQVCSMDKICKAVNACTQNNLLYDACKLIDVI